MTSQILGLSQIARVDDVQQTAAEAIGFMVHQTPLRLAVVVFGLDLLFRVSAL